MRNFISEMLPFVALFGMLAFASCQAQKKTNNKQDAIIVNASKWKDILDEKEYYIMVKKGTEYPGSSALNSEKRVGVYVSAATGDTLFVSSSKFKSGTGWPSFDDATDKVALGPAEQGGYEVIEKSTGLHLGHLFEGEYFTRKNKRYCINGEALEFIPQEDWDSKACAEDPNCI